MALNVITGSPYNYRIITDPNYIVSASVPTLLAAGAFVGTSSLAVTGSTPSLNFIQAIPYPTTEEIIVRLGVSQITGTTGSLAYPFSLQQSPDNATWANIPQFTSSLATAIDSAGTASAVYTDVLLPPNVQQYIRAKVSVPATGSQDLGLTGSYTLTVLF